jgi:hypothetical protein
LCSRLVVLISGGCFFGVFLIFINAVHHRAICSTLE